MSKPNDGGPAFPFPAAFNTELGVMVPKLGMSLREWFSGMAMIGYMAGKANIFDHGVSDTRDPSSVSKASVSMADALIAELGRGVK